MLARAVALSAACAGCTQILGFRQDYYEVTGSAEAGGGPDAGDWEDAIAGDGPATPFCRTLSPKPFFCVDFDENAPDPYGWSFAHMAAGNLALDTSEFVSSPASLLVQTNVVTSATGTVDTSVFQTLELSGQTFDGMLDLSMRVDGVDAPGGVAVLAQFGLTDGAGGGMYYLQFVTTSNGAQPLGLQIAEDYFATGTMGMPVDHFVSSVIPIGTWTRVKLSMMVPFAGGAGTATLVINDDPPTVTGLQVPVQAFAPPIGVGVLYASAPSNGWSATFDNVVFTSASK